MFFWNPIQTQSFIKKQIEIKRTTVQKRQKVRNFCINCGSLKAGGSWLTKERQKFENFTEEKFQSFYQSAAINIEVINVFHENQDAVSIFVNGNLTSLTGYKTDVIQDF
ncbi:unnamed protein product [Rhizophagus irregularis]|nr:unnamed protein product [Rhizophagus irregularis]